MSTCYSHCIFGQCNLKVKIPIKYSLNNSLICFYIIWAFFFPHSQMGMAATVNKKQSSTIFTLDSCGCLDYNFNIVITGTMPRESLQTRAPKLSKRGIQHPEKVLCQNLRFFQHIFPTQFYIHSLRAAVSRAAAQLLMSTLSHCF